MFPSQPKLRIDTINLPITPHPPQRENTLFTYSPLLNRSPNSHFLPTKFALANSPVSPHVHPLTPTPNRRAPMPPSTHLRSRHARRANRLLAYHTEPAKKGLWTVLEAEERSTYSSEEEDDAMDVDQFQGADKEDAEMDYFEDVDIHSDRPIPSNSSCGILTPRHSYESIGAQVKGTLIEADGLFRLETLGSGRKGLAIMGLSLAQGWQMDSDEEDDEAPSSPTSSEESFSSCILPCKLEFAPLENKRPPPLDLKQVNRLAKTMERSFPKLGSPFTPMSGSGSSSCTPMTAARGHFAAALDTSTPRSFAYLQSPPPLTRASVSSIDSASVWAQDELLTPTPGLVRRTDMEMAFEDLLNEAKEDEDALTSPLHDMRDPFAKPSKKIDFPLPPFHLSSSPNDTLPPFHLSSSPNDILSTPKKKRHPVENPPLPYRYSCRQAPALPITPPISSHALQSITGIAADQRGVGTIAFPAVLPPLLPKALVTPPKSSRALQDVLGVSPISPTHKSRTAKTAGGKKLPGRSPLPREWVDRYGSGNIL